MHMSDQQGGGGGHHGRIQHGEDEAEIGEQHRQRFALVTCVTGLSYGEMTGLSCGEMTGLSYGEMTGLPYGEMTGLCCYKSLACTGS